MKHTVTKLIISTLLLAALSAAAELPVNEMAVNEMSKVITETALPSECLAPVVITSIDGVKQAVPGNGFPLEPGVHSVNGLVLLDTTKCRRPDVELDIRTTADLVVDFEAGKIYYIAYDRTFQNPEEWKLVVWKIEQSNSPEDQLQE